jgi:hypothetical protein
MPQEQQSPVQFVSLQPAGLLSVLLYPSFVPFYHCETRYIAGNIENQPEKYGRARNCALDEFGGPSPFFFSELLGQTTSARYRNHQSLV